MAYEVLVASDKENNARTGSRSVTFLIRQGTDVKAAEIGLEKDADAVAYGEANAAALFAGGAVPPAKADPLALFYAMQTRQSEGYFLNVIFKAFRQLKLNGNLTAMVGSAREALGEDDALFARWQAFETVYKAGSAEDRETLQAMAMWVVMNLTASR